MPWTAIEKRVEGLTKCDSLGATVGAQAASCKVMGRMLELDPERYREYERQRLEHIAKAVNGDSKFNGALAGKPTTADDPDDGDEDDSMLGAKNRDDDDDEGEDDEDDGDGDYEKRKLRAKGLRIAKALGLTLVTSESIRKQAPSKLCPSCGSEIALSSPVRHNCGKRF